MIMIQSKSIYCKIIFESTEWSRNRSDFCFPNSCQIYSGCGLASCSVPVGFQFFTLRKCCSSLGVCWSKEAGWSKVSLLMVTAATATSKSVWVDGLKSLTSPCWWIFRFGRRWFTRMYQNTQWSDCRCGSASTSTKPFGGWLAPATWLLFHIF